MNTLLGTFPTDGPQPPILPPVEGFLFLDRKGFHHSFAGDLPEKQAMFYARQLASSVGCGSSGRHDQ